MITAETTRNAAVMIAAGMGVPLLAALNAQMGQRIGSPSVAAIILFFVAMLGALLVSQMTTGLSPLAKVPAQPKFLLAAGLLMVFYLVSITWIVPRLFENL